MTTDSEGPFVGRHRDLATYFPTPVTGGRASMSWMHQVSHSLVGMRSATQISDDGTMVGWREITGTSWTGLTVSFTGGYWVQIGQIVWVRATCVATAADGTFNGFTLPVVPADGILTDVVGAGVIDPSPGYPFVVRHEGDGLAGFYCQYPDSGPLIDGTPVTVTAHYLSLMLQYRVDPPPAGRLHAFDTRTLYQNDTS